MFSLNPFGIFVPKFRNILKGRRGGRLGLHSEWTIGPYELPDGRMRPVYKRRNICHNLGEQALLQLIFGLQFTTFSWQVLADNCSCVHATKTLTDDDGGAAIGAYATATDLLYLVGGETPKVTAGYYTVASITSTDIIVLTGSPCSTANDIEGGITVIREHNFGIGLDARNTLAEADTTATAEAYEEDGTDYVRYQADPLSSEWTVALNATSLDYEATSSQVTFTAGAADWQANKNAFLVMGLCDTNASGTAANSVAADWSNDVLLSSVPFDDPITVGNGQSLPLQVVWKLTEE